MQSTQSNQTENLIPTEICIIGAGPGGAAAALQLAQLNIPCMVVDRAIFPRDKICGDALSGKVVSNLNKIDPTIIQNFKEREDLKINCWGIKFTYPKGIELDYRYKSHLAVEEIQDEEPVSFVAKRIDFDNYLAELLRENPLIDFREGVQITDFEKVDNAFLLKNKKATLQIKATLVIAADGAQSQFAKNIGGITKDPKHFAGGVRAYYKNVTGLSDFNHIELHYVNELAPGYLWIFPLQNGEANVGLGLRTDVISKKKKNLRKDLERLLEEHPRFKDRFRNAERVSKIQGFGLPFGSKKRKISGENYMLIGDAASLIDPLTGEGIGNAIVSGRFAAIHAQKCLEANDFSPAKMAEYDKIVYHHLWQELKISGQLLTIAQYPKVVQFLTKIASKNDNFIELLSAMFNDVDLRKKLRSPKFYFGLIFNRK